MNPRERAMAMISMIGILVLVAWYSGISDLFDSIFSENGDVAAQETVYNSYIDAFEDIYVIESQFRKIGEFPKNEENTLKPSLAFTQQVSQICRDLGFETPPIQADTDEIEGVETYELINVALKTEGNFKDTIKLLKTFQERGMIFRDVDLKGTRDQDIVSARVTVARIAERPRRPTPRRGRPR